jgi:hypothetical protein
MTVFRGENTAPAQYESGFHFSQFCPKIIPRSWPFESTIFPSVSCETRSSETSNPESAYFAVHSQKPHKADTARVSATCPQRLEITTAVLQLSTLAEAGYVIGRNTDCPRIHAAPEYAPPMNIGLSRFLYLNLYPTNVEYTVSCQ